MSVARLSEERALLMIAQICERCADLIDQTLDHDTKNLIINAA
jgi:hypothetical protein